MICGLGSGELRCAELSRELGELIGNLHGPGSEDRSDQPRQRANEYQNHAPVTKVCRLIVWGGVSEMEATR